MILRRLGPASQNQSCPSLDNCPVIAEGIDGTFIIVGEDITETVRGKLSHGISAGPDERVIRVPRRLLIEAKADIPNE